MDKSRPADIASMIIRTAHGVHPVLREIAYIAAESRPTDSTQQAVARQDTLERLILRWALPLEERIPSVAEEVAELLLIYARNHPRPKENQ